MQFFKRIRLSIIRPIIPKSIAKIIANLNQKDKDIILSLRALEKQELDTYIKPFKEEGESRRPTLTWPRQIPIEGEPAGVVEIAKNYAQFMSETQLPKLFINADPGSILIGKQRELARKWPNQKEVTVKGGHFIQEISPDEIGESIKEFLIGLKG